MKAIREVPLLEESMKAIVKGILLPQGNRTSLS